MLLSHVVFNILPFTNTVPPNINNISVDGYRDAILTSSDHLNPRLFQALWIVEKFSWIINKAV